MSHDPMLIVGSDHLIRYANTSTERSLEIESDAVLGLAPADLAEVDDRAAVKDLFTQADRSPRATASAEVQLRRSDGQSRWYDVSVVNLLDVPEVGGYTVQARDVTERRGLADVLGRQATIDPPTGLLNRRGLMGDLERGIVEFGATGRPTGLLFLDLDRFKSINDHHGHEAGDAVLVTVAERLAAVVRAGGSVGRLGGDEFVVLLPGATGAELTAVAQEIIVQMAPPVPYGTTLLRTRASIGMALTDRPRHTAISLLRAADMVLYQSKRMRDDTPVMGIDPPE